MSSINVFIDSVRAELKLSGKVNISTKKAKDAFGIFSEMSYFLICNKTKHEKLVFYGENIQNVSKFRPLITVLLLSLHHMLLDFHTNIVYNLNPY